MKIGDKCVTWNCGGKVVGNSKREDGSWMDVKCAICDRKYWHNNMLKDNYQLNCYGNMFFEVGRNEVLEKLREDFKDADPITKILINGFINRIINSSLKDDNTQEMEE